MYFSATLDLAGEKAWSTRKGSSPLPTTDAPDLVLIGAPDPPRVNGLRIRRAAGRDRRPFGDGSSRRSSGRRAGPGGTAHPRRRPPRRSRRPGLPGQPRPRPVRGPQPAAGLAATTCRARPPTSTRSPRTRAPTPTSRGSSAAAGRWSTSPAGRPARRTSTPIVPDRPVFLFNRDVHGAWVNSMALELGGDHRATPRTRPTAGSSATRRPASRPARLHEGAAYRLQRQRRPDPDPAGVGGGDPEPASAPARARHHRAGRTPG